MNGLVVHGKAGRRESYRPIASRLCECARPIAIANAIRETYGISDLYIADLDAIGGGSPAIDLYQTLASEGFELTVDAGLHVPRDLERLDSAGVSTIVAGLETLEGPESLAGMVRRRGAERVLFSLDMKEGVPMGNRAAWKQQPAEEIARRAVDGGVRRILLLDLARVGMGQGLGTENLARCILDHPRVVELTLGGGIRQVSDLVTLASMGVHAALVATLLHQGPVTRADIRSLVENEGKPGPARPTSD